VKHFLHLCPSLALLLCSAKTLLLQLSVYDKRVSHVGVFGTQSGLAGFRLFCKDDWFEGPIKQALQHPPSSIVGYCVHSACWMEQVSQRTGLRKDSEKEATPSILLSLVFAKLRREQVPLFIRH
jgi:hypothetical protein